MASVGNVSNTVRPGFKKLAWMGDSFTFGIAVKDAETYPAQAEKLKPGTSVPLLIQRNGGPLFLALDVPAADSEK